MLSYDFGNGHVMNAERLLAAYHLLEKIYITNEEAEFQLITPEDYDRKYLFKAHTRNYIEKFEALSQQGKGQALEFGLGTPDCPIWQGMANISNFVVKSTVTLAKQIYNGKLNIGFGLLGGLHHATAAEASGFCYYNDINVAVQRLKALNPDIRILYVDTDLHHGDGVQSTFYQDPNILTISFHESGKFLFPGSGFPLEIGEKDGEGYSVNLPFYPYTWDEEYQHGFDQVFPILFEQYQPDFVIWQAGGDAHIKDPLGHLMLTSHTYRHIGAQIRDQVLKHMQVPKVLMLGGGGYNPYSNAKSWSNALSGLTGVTLPDRGPESWIIQCKSSGIEVNPSLQDTQSTPIKEDVDQITTGNAEYLAQLKSHLTPYFSL